MIHKTPRFQGRNSLRFVYQKGETVRGAAMNLRYILNNRNTSYRAAVVVSKKVHKSAVVRNRIRRRIYEFVRLSMTKVDKPYDIVFLTYSDQLADMPAEQLRENVNSLLAKAGITE